LTGTGCDSSKGIKVTLSDQEKRGLLSFIGYGSPSAPLWFIGAEEGLGGKMLGDEERKNLRARGAWNEVMDLCAAHLTLTESGAKIDIREKRKGSIAVWLWMSRIARAFEGSRDWNEKERAREYVQTRLGRLNETKSPTTFLTELSPVPEKKTGEPKWLVELRSGDESHKLLAQREARIRELLHSHGPKLVVCYGLRTKQEFARLLNVDSWIEVAKGVLKAPDKNVFLLPFFGQAQISEALVSRLVSLPSFHVGP
jgi:hypothetical protein